MAFGRAIGKFVNDVVGGHSLTDGREPATAGRPHKYAVNGLSYPLEMGVDAPMELDHHVIFDIFVDETTEFSSLAANTTEGKPKAFVAPKGQEAGTTNISHKIRDNVETDLKNLANITSQKFGEVNKTAGKGVKQGAEGLGGVADQIFKGPRKMKKLNSSIALQVPNSFQMGSSANYSGAALGQMAGLFNRKGGISGLISKAMDPATRGDLMRQEGGDVARVIAENVIKIPDAFGLNLGNILTVSTRRVANQHVEQRFDDMSFREFSFAYEFSARSEAEAVAIDNIIKTFRFHMHPELVESGLFFSFPSLFDISIMFKEDHNPFIHRISTCVLTSFTTNYTSTGVWSTTRDGQPTEIQCTMNFREIEPMTKHRIAEGF